jgi:hypothetical protein
MVPSRSSSSGALRARKRRSRRSAILMLRVPSSTPSSRLRYSRASQTLSRAPWRPACADAHALGLKPWLPNGEVPPVPIHLLPPSCRPAARAAAAQGLEQLFPAPERIGARAFSSSLNSRSSSCFSHSAAARARASRTASRAGEVLGEHAVETIEMPLVLHQGHARQVVEILGRQGCQACLQPSSRFRNSGQRDRYAAGAQVGEKSHSIGCAAQRPARRLRNTSCSNRCTSCSS